MFLFNKKYIGKNFNGYTIEKNLGQGRYGLCFLAKDKSKNRVVIKKFKSGFFKKYSERDVHEAVILSKLEDNRIPKFLGVINEKSFYAYVLEFKNGNTVRELLFKNNYRFTHEEIFNIGLKLLDIIKYLHENKVIHGDISISNVIINGNNVYLIDFGLARQEDSSNLSYDMDFSYFGDFLLYLLYSNVEIKKNNKKIPWYDELILNSGQKKILKKLFGLENKYNTVNEIFIDFVKEFKID